MFSKKKCLLVVAFVATLSCSAIRGFTGEEIKLANQVRAFMVKDKDIKKDLASGGLKYRTDDGFVIKFIRKNSVQPIKSRAEYTAKNIAKFITVVKEYKDQFQSTISKNCTGRYNKSIKLLAHRAEGSPVYFLKFEKDWKEADVWPMVIPTAFIGQQLNEKEEVQKNRFILVVDARDADKAVLYNFGTVIKKCSVAVFPMKPRAIIVLNSPSGATLVFKAIATTFRLKQYVQDMISFLPKKSRCKGKDLVKLLKAEQILNKKLEDETDIVFEETELDTAFVKELETKEINFNGFWPEP